MSVLEVALAMLEGGDEKPPRRNFDASGHSQDGLTDSYNNRVPFGTAIDVSLRDSQRGASSANYYPQYPSPQPPQQQFNPSPFASPSPYGAPSPHTPSPLAPRPSLGAGPGMVPYGTPSHSMGMESGLSSLPSCSSLAHTSHFCRSQPFTSDQETRFLRGRRMEGRRR